MTQTQHTTADRIYLLLVDRLQVIGGTRHAAEDIADEIDGWRGKLESARADIEEAKDERDALTAQRDEARAWKPALDEAVEALAEARAQIAALQVKAEAWDTREKWLETSDVNYRLLAQAAAARAREVKS